MKPEVAKAGHANIFQALKVLPEKTLTGKVLAILLTHDEFKRESSPAPLATKRFQL